MSGSAAGVVTTATGPARRASASSSGVVSTTSPRNAVWMTSAVPTVSWADPVVCRTEFRWNGTRLVNLEDREERFLRDLDRSHLLHPLLALALLLQELAFEIGRASCRERV